MTSNLKYLLISLLPLFAISSQAGDFEWSDLGLRVGIDAENRVDVKSYELIAILESPWSWSANDHFEIDLGFEFGLGALDGEGETGLLAHVGPSLEFEFGDFPLEFIISSGPALLSEHEFDNLDLGGSFQFMSAVGFDFEVSEEWTLGYRWLHISNAGLHDENPGMNLHALSLFYEF
ncbi:MAG TPA: acyloxyacyl hydrolase [Opitutales bacterium]|nr:acyloxyacyl hydrolase [Opitutales bacterium]